MQVDIIIHFLKQNNPTSFQHADYLSGTAECWYFLQSGVLVRSSTKDENILSVSLLQIFAILANIWTSEHNVRLASKLKYDIAHKYPCLSEYIVSTRMQAYYYSLQKKFSRIRCSQADHSLIRVISFLQKIAFDEKQLLMNDLPFWKKDVYCTFNSASCRSSFSSFKSRKLFSLFSIFAKFSPSPS